MNDEQLSVIGVAGFAQSGKDTTGQFLIDAHGFTRVSFADAVRETLYALNPLISLSTSNLCASSARLQVLVDGLGWEAAKNSYTEIRELLQRMGTEVGRELIHPEVWVQIAKRKAEKILADGGRVVFTDVRFENEAAVIHQMGGQIVRVHRNGVSSVNNHKSDQPLPDEYVDIELDNSGTIQTLHDNIESCIFGVPKIFV